MESNEWVTGEVVLSIGGEPVKMEMTVPAGPIKPHRMLPVFQKMTNSFVEMSTLAAAAQGHTVSCRAGCGACCRQPVPISELEIYQLADLVDSMPEPRRTEIKTRFRDAVEHFRSKKWFKRIKEVGDLTLTESRDTVVKEINVLAMEYFHEGVACPFLEDESCSIHESRPVACREYLVTSPATNCSSPTAENIRMVHLVMKPSNTLRYVGNTGTFPGFIPMIMALELAEEYPEKFEKKTGERWAADFFSKLVHQPIPKEGIADDRPKRRRNARSRRKRP